MSMESSFHFFLDLVDANMDSISRRTSNGGVAANMSSLFSWFNSWATNRLLHSGAASSPLLMSTHRVPMGPFPVVSQHSLIGTCL